MPQAVIINGRNYTWSRLVSVVEVENRFVKKKIRKPVFFLRLKQKHRELTMPVQKHESAHPQFVQVDDYEPTIDISDLLDSSCRATLESAFSLAESLNHRHVEPLHIFLSSLQDDSVQAFFSRLDLDFEGLKEPLGRRLNQRQIGKFKYASEETINLVLHAFVNAYLQQRNVVNVFELFFEAYNREDFVRELLHDKGVTADKFGNMIEWVRIHERMRERYRRFHTATILKPTGPMNRAMNSVATPTLDSISEDLTTYGAQGKLPMFIGRDAEIAEIFRVMEGARQSVVLVGPGGVGKRAILSGLAQLMVEERVPELLKDKRLVRLSITHLLAGATQSQAQERLLRALQESDRSGNIVLALTDIEQLVGASSNLNGSGDLVATLVDVLKRTGMLAIATTTHQSFFRSVESSVLSRAFEKVDVAEPDIRDAIHVLESKIGGIEHDSSVSFSYSAVEASVTLTDRYMHERYLPEKAIEIARETADYVSKIKGKGTFVTDQDVARIVSQKTDIPLMQVEEKEKDKLLALEQRMHERLIGQDQAVSAVVSALRRVSAQPRSDDRPIATLLFLGPTGVGKTELAKTIAETYFNTETSIIRLDMSEYQNRSGLARMLGSAESKQDGNLIEAIRQRPFSILLLDEFEKADPTILNLFLQIFESGRLADSTGRSVDLTNVIIIATSDVGGPYVQEALVKGWDINRIKINLLEQELCPIYTPKLLDSFDGVIAFKSLTQPEIERITEMLIDEIARKLQDKEIDLRVEDEIIADLAGRGYDVRLGARTMRRFIQDEVGSVIDNQLLEGNVSRRDTIVLTKDGVLIEKAQRV